MERGGWWNFGDVLLNSVLDSRIELINLCFWIIRQLYLRSLLWLSTNLVMSRLRVFSKSIFRSAREPDYGGKSVLKRARDSQSLSEAAGPKD